MLSDPLIPATARNSFQSRLNEYTLQPQRTHLAGTRHAVFGSSAWSLLPLPLLDNGRQYVSCPLSPLPYSPPDSSQCINCYQKKVRCDFLPQAIKCTRCIQNGLECLLPTETQKTSRPSMRLVSRVLLSQHYWPLSTCSSYRGAYSMLLLYYLCEC